MQVEGVVWVGSGKVLGMSSVTMRLVLAVTVGCPDLGFAIWPILIIGSY